MYVSMKRMLENANRRLAPARKSLAQSPSADEKASAVSETLSDPELCGAVTRITAAVSVHMTSVSSVTSATPHNPSSSGEEGRLAL